jgi:hypothetical protein
MGWLWCGIYIWDEQPGTQQKEQGMQFRIHLVASLALVIAMSSAAVADVFTFNSGVPDGKMATASRPDIPAGAEIESADDFITPSGVIINHATFTGLVTGTLAPGTIGQVVVEIYRVFPNDSNVGRTSGPPTFSTSSVPTRVNSPSDVAFDSRSSTSNLTFTTSVLNQSFTALNSVQPGGIHPIPGQTTGGNGPVTGQEVLFDVTFTTPFSLPSDHFFFVPQVQVTGGNFFWLSAARPITGPGTTPFAPDLQSWTRDEALQPDWLRVGTDIVGGATPPTFNASFTLDGQTAPEPSAIALFGSGALLLVFVRGYARRR